MIFMHPQMILFDSSSSDHMQFFADWWDATSQLSNRFEGIPEFESIESALGQFSDPNITFFLRDASGIYALFWIKPTLGGGVFGVWIRPAYRSSRFVYRRFIEFLNYAFLVFPIIYCFVSEERLLLTLKTLGFNVIGIINKRILSYLLAERFTRRFDPQISGNNIFIAYN